MFEKINIIAVENMSKGEIWFGHIRTMEIDLPEIKFGYEVEGKIININKG